MPIERVANWPAAGHFGATPRGTFESAVAGAAPVGSTAFTVIVALARYNARPNTSSGALVSHSSSVATSGGWRFYTKYGGGEGLRMSIADSGSSERLVGGMQVLRPGEVDVAVGSYESGVGYGLATAIGDETAGPFTGYTPNGDSSPLVFGGTLGNGSFPSQDHAIIGFLATDSMALDAAGRAAARDLVKANLRGGRDLDQGLSAIVAPETYWDARDIDWVDALWTDRVGGVVMNVVRDVQRVGVAGRVT